MKTTDIKFVKERKFNGMTYGWFVGGKAVSDSRNYAVYENGKTIIAEFPKESLPKFIQKFIDSRQPMIWDEENEFTTIMYMYK